MARSFPSIGARLAAFARRFKELQGSPTYLARGVAIGVFIGIAPVLPLKTILIVSMTFLVPSSTIAAILVCTAICNPFTFAPLYYIAWLVGSLMFPGKVSWAYLKATLGQIQQSTLIDALMIAGQVGYDTAVVMLAGGLILAVPLSILSYLVSIRIFHRHKKGLKD